MKELDLSKLNIGNSDPLQGFDIGLQFSRSVLHYSIDLFTNSFWFETPLYADDIQYFVDKRIPLDSSVNIIIDPLDDKTNPQILKINLAPSDEEGQEFYGAIIRLDKAKTGHHFPKLEIVADILDIEVIEGTLIGKE